MRLLSATAAAAALVALAAGPASAVAANPATWRISQVTRLPFSSFYDAVALSPTNVWALGKHATRQGPLVSMVWHWNGRTWRRAPFPVSADGLSVYPAIAGTSRANIWAFNLFSARHWNGQAQVLARWHAGTWSYTRLPAYVTDGKVFVFAMLAEPHGDVWLGGGAIGLGGGPNAGVLIRYRNGRWHQYRGSDPGDVRSIVSDGSGGVWAAGGPTALAHVNGRGLHEVRLPGVRGKQTDVGLLVRAPRSSALFALGELDWSNTPTLSYGAILRYAR